MVRIFYFIFFFLLLSHFYPLLLSPLNPHTLHFFPLQAPIPPLTANPSPYPAPTNLFVLRPSFSAVSFFLYSVSQSFSIPNTKTHDRRCWVLILSPWLTKRRCRRDRVLLMGSVNGFYFYFDEWVLILLMVDEWGLLMVDEWVLLMVKWVFFYSWVMPWWVIGLCRGVRGSCCGGSRLSFSFVAVCWFSWLSWLGLPWVLFLWLWVDFLGQLWADFGGSICGLCEVVVDRWWWWVVWSGAWPVVAVVMVVYWNRYIILL